MKTSFVHKPVGALAVGGLMAFGGSFVRWVLVVGVNIALSIQMSPAEFGSLLARLKLPETIIGFVLECVTLLASGWVVGKLVQRKKIVYGVVLGMLIAIISLLPVLIAFATSPQDSLKTIYLVSLVTHTSTVIVVFRAFGRLALISIITGLGAWLSKKK